MSVYRKENIILDFDGRLENIIPLLYAFYFQKIEIITIILTYGVHSLQTSRENIFSMLSILNIEARQVILIECAEEPLCRDRYEIPNLLSYDTLTDQNQENGSSIESQPVLKGFQEVVNILEEKEEVTQICMGVCTSLILLLKNQPKLHSKFSHIIVMGGALEKGNVSPQAEFNCFADPEAMCMLLRLRKDTILIPLDVCNQCILTPVAMKTLQSTFAKFTNINWITRALQEHMALTLSLPSLSHTSNEFTPLFNAVGLIQVLYPMFFDVRKKQIYVELKSSLTAGRIRIGTAKKTKDNLLIDQLNKEEQQELLLLDNEPVARNEFILVNIIEKINEKVVIKRILDDFNEIKEYLCKENEDSQIMK